MQKKTVLQNKKSCTGCHSCFNICPNQAITMEYDDEGFLFPVINDSACIHCGLCEKSCPVLYRPLTFKPVKAFAAYASNLEEQKCSSSGGVFSVLARTILEKGGYVCGATQGNDLNVSHIIINKESQLDQLKGTKYVQSEIGTVYSQIKSVLEDDYLLLFSGTPCQVAGLKAYLGKDYSNLILVDLICHGVPSPFVLKRYIQELSNTPVVKMDFRNKSKGISKKYLSYELVNGDSLIEDYIGSHYMKGFTQNLFNRNSCFECQFKGVERCSDFTIGDFWAIREFHPDMASDQGTSAVIIHTDKGMDFWNEIYSELIIKEAAIEEIKTWNTCLTESIAYNPKRKDFFDYWDKMTIKEAVNLLAYDSKEIKKSSRIRTFLSGIIHRKH